ncbi:MAG: M20/M25/M40 family metallo-hydrolase [Acidobacteria bacterium]|nr:M20/M25/M40 family metallo-hydrolase [Acidobacteriota bacterium]
MKKTPLLYLIYSIIFSFSLSGPGFPQEIPDGMRALAHVNHLASDAFRGRKSGTAEYLRAAEYVAEKMQEFGLQPGGDNSTYFQQVPFKNWKDISPPARLEIKDPLPFSFVPGRGKDFSPWTGTGSGTARGKLAFAGYGLISKKLGWNDYADINVKGRIVLIIPGAPDFLKEIPTKEKSDHKKIETAIDRGAAGVIFLNIGPATRRRSGGSAKVPVYPENFVVASAEIRVVDKIFYSLGLSWRTLVSRTLREKKTHSRPLDMTVEMEAHFVQEDREAPNVIGILPGQHPERKNETILIGGHLDHLGVDLDGTVYNGADDNAASVAVILEIARVFQRNNFKPDRTIVFIGWAGEELGLVGSRHYTGHPLYPLEKTLLYINLDMVGTGDSDLFVGGMWEFADLFDIIKQNLSPELTEKLRFRYDYRGSDHSAFLPKGVSAISLRTGHPLTRELDDEHPEYHRPGDAPNIIQPELLELAADYNIQVLEFLGGCPNNLLIPKHHIYFLHKTSFVADMHCDTISRALNGTDLAKEQDEGHIDIPKLKKGAVDLQVFACYVGPPSNDLQKASAAKLAFDQIDAVHELVENNPDDLLLITSFEDTRLLRETRKTGVLIGIEGGYAIENDIRLLRSFYRSGVRLMTLTHWLDTDWADASGDPEAQLGGLTDLGKEVVREMNKLGMIIDVSHSHDETFRDVVALSKHPIIASHSCCRALSDHHRNLSDKMLKALAKNGGVIGINFAPGFLNASVSDQLRALRGDLLKKHDLPEDREAFEKTDVFLKGKPQADVRTVVDHIEHVIKVTGNTNHVGLGSDFDGIGSTPEGLENVGLISNITAELYRRGHKDADIKKILGGNFQRVLRQVCGSRR